MGAAIGGFAGDALPVARALSSVVDCLITHPNVSCDAHLAPTEEVDIWRPKPECLCDEHWMIPVQRSKGCPRKHHTDWTSGKLFHARVDGGHGRDTQSNFHWSERPFFKHRLGRD